MSWSLTEVKGLREERETGLATCLWANMLTACDKI